MPPAVAEVLEEDEREHGYPGTVSADDVRSWWRRTKLDENSWTLEEDGAIVALGWLEQYGDDIVVVGVVRPGKGGEGLGSMLVDIGERRGRELGGTCFRQITLGADNGARALFEARDYRAARRHYVMAIDLSSEPRGAGSAGRLRDRHLPGCGGTRVPGRSRRGIRGGVGLPRAAVRRVVGAAEG